MSQPSDMHLREIKKIYVFSFFWMFLVLMPVVVPYFLSLGLSMEQVFQLQAIFGLGVALLEVPSGYLCDLWGRKNTILIGSFFWGVSGTFLFFASNFWHLVFYEVLSAVSLSLVSGADLSILYDRLKEIHGDDRKQFTQAIGNIQMAKVTGESVASIIGGLLALISFAAVIGGHVVASWFPFIVAMTIKEPSYQKMSREDHRGNIKKILSHVLFSEKLLTLTFLNLVTWGLATYIAVWIFQKHWHESGIALGYFGLLWASYNLTVGIVGKQVHRLEHRYGAIPLILILAFLPVAGFLGLAFFTGWVGVMMGYLFKISRGLTQVILKDALNWRTPSEMRATVNSLVSLTFRVSFAVIGPAVGFTIDRWDLTNSLIGLSAVFLSLAMVLTIPLVMEIKNAHIEEIPFENS